MLINNNEYFEILNNIKKQILDAQYKAVLGVNQEQIMLFWNIGKTIIANTKYGVKFIDNLAKDIKTEFPNLKGYSVRNLKYMRRFAEFCPNEQKEQTLSAQLSWSHNIELFNKTKTLAEYEWYAEKTTEDEWSVRTLEYHIETKGYERQALPQSKASNYQRLLIKNLRANFASI